MFSPATLAATDRLIAVLMTLFHALAPVIRSGGTRTFSIEAANAVFFRLNRLVTDLTGLTIHGPGTRRTHRAEPESAAPSPRSPVTLGSPAYEDSRLRHEPGWLLDALPGTADAVAADLGDLLADPAVAALLDAAPSLIRTLNPLLRGLGLDPLEPRPLAPATVPSPSPPLSSPPPSLSASGPGNGSAHPSPAPQVATRPPRISTAT